MPGNIKEAPEKYKYAIPYKPQHCPYPPELQKYGAASQEPEPDDYSNIKDLEFAPDWTIVVFDGTILN